MRHQVQVKARNLTGTVQQGMEVGMTVLGTHARLRAGKTQLRQLASAAGGLLAFIGPAQPYPVVSAEDLAEASWAGVGQSLNWAMRTVDREIGTAAPDHAADNG